MSGLASSLGQGDRLSVVTFDEFTDGKITTEPDSPYKTMESQAWTRLATRAAALGGDTAAFALGQAQVTDAAAMQRVFPAADLVADGVEIVDYLSGLSQEVLLHRIGGLLEPDSGSQLTVSWGKDAVTVTSPLAHVPLQVTNLTLSGNAGTVEGTQPMILGPGESSILPVHLTDGFAGAATLLDTVTSPWQGTLQELDFVLPVLALTPLRVAAAEPSASPEPSSSPTPAASEITAAGQPSERPAAGERTASVLTVALWAVAGGAGLLVLVMLVGIIRPRLRGSLTLEGPGYRREIALTGRRMGLPANPLGLRGHVSGARGVAAVRTSINAPDGARLRTGLTDGESASLGDSSILWKDERTLLEDRLGLSSPGQTPPSV